MSSYSIIWNFEELMQEQKGKRARVFNESSVRYLVHRANYNRANHNNFLRIEVLHSIRKYNGNEISGTILTITVDKENLKIICNYKRVADGGASLDKDPWGNSRFDYAYKYFYKDENCINADTGEHCEFSKGFGVKF